MYNVLVKPVLTLYIRDLDTVKYWRKVITFIWQRDTQMHSHEVHELFNLLKPKRV
jgi:hypothetical protein